MNHGGTLNVHVLYKISNDKGDTGAYNAFEIPNSRGSVTLKSVKSHCLALNRINSAGADGFHWRVRVDDKQSNPKAPPKYSWWDIQDESARLPLKEVTFAELSHILSGRSSYSSSSSDDSSRNAASSMTRSLGKALKNVANTVDGGASNAHHANFPRIPIIMFKLLDMTKVYDKHSGSTGGYTSRPAPKVRTSAPASRRAAAPTPAPAPAQRRTKAPAARRAAPKAAPKVREGSLMDFGAPASAPAAQRRVLHHSNTAPPAMNETRAEKLKREYEKKKQTENRVWDEVDQRWVTVDPNQGSKVNQSSASAPPGGNANVASNKPKLKGVSLDNVNLAGKSAEVASAVQSRVNEMKESQEKALKEIREREAAKAKSESDEDLVRQKLEPKIKAWAEEHGKKKQLRALLASMDKVLWPGAKWKPIGLGDLLDDKKVKVGYHKASRVVHPDKTMSLGPEERFLAKRIFDSLAQAKTQWDSTK